jgi:hypothetical protein
MHGRILSEILGVRGSGSQTTVQRIGGWPVHLLCFRNVRPEKDGKGSLVCSLTARAQRRPSDSLPRYFMERSRLPFTARIERAHSYRARYASKKGIWPLPLILLRPRVAQARE